MFKSVHITAVIPVVLEEGRRVKIHPLGFGGTRTRMSPDLTESMIIYLHDWCQQTNETRGQNVMLCTSADDMNNEYFDFIITEKMKTKGGRRHEVSVLL